MKNFDDLKKELQEENIEIYITTQIVGKLIAIRDKNKISQRKLSDASGVPQKTISRIENGIDVPKLSTLQKLANALNSKIVIDVNVKENE